MTKAQVTSLNCLFIQPLDKYTNNYKDIKQRKNSHISEAVTNWLCSVILTQTTY